MGTQDDTAEGNLDRLKAENLELRRRLVEALACARFYEAAASDSGERARSILEGLQSRPG
jgi:hypothetical protein